MLRIAASPALSLLLCYLAGVTSFAASPIAVFVTAMGLLPPLVAAGVSPVGAVLALPMPRCWSTSTPRYHRRTDPRRRRTGGPAAPVPPAARPRPGVDRHCAFLAWLAFGRW
jgi:hypothetical protein